MTAGNISAKSAAPFVIHVNHSSAKAVIQAEDVRNALETLAGAAKIAARNLVDLHVELDYLQYKNNFRESAYFVPLCDSDGNRQPSGGVLQLDARRLAKSNLLDQIATAFRPGPRLYLEEYCSLRESLIWRFNQFYWMHFDEWEQWTGRSYEKALPGGSSDSHQTAAVADSVEEFWNLLKKLEDEGKLPGEILALEIGVGNGTRVAMFLDQFREFDRARGTGYYARFKMLLGDYSLATFEQTRRTVANHIDRCEFLEVDALNPLDGLAQYRGKVLYVHLTNVYDNLLTEEAVRRLGRLYLIQTRAYLPLAAAQRIFDVSGADEEKLRAAADHLLKDGPASFSPATGHDGVGMMFWQELWKGVRLEERLVPLDLLPASVLPASLEPATLEEILKDAPQDFRLHLSTGALKSFVETLPLLHDRGYIQVLDIFAREFSDFKKGFKGPGKMDGSIVNWVNGALLKAVAGRMGYDVRFESYKYRAGSATSIMYASRRAQ